MLTQGPTQKILPRVEEKDMSDMVNSPAHYNQSDIECIDAIRAALGEEGFVAYCRGNAIKYNWRAGHKFDTTEDLHKAAWYSRMAAGDDPRPKAQPEYIIASPGNIVECSPPGHITPACKHGFTHCSSCEFSAGRFDYVPPECDERTKN